VTWLLRNISVVHFVATKSYQTPANLVVPSLHRIRQIFQKLRMAPKPIE